MVRIIDRVTRLYISNGRGTIQSQQKRIKSVAQHEFDNVTQLPPLTFRQRHVCDTPCDVGIFAIEKFENDLLLRLPQRYKFRGIHNGD